MGLKGVGVHAKSPPHKQHIWFLPTRKPTLKNQKSCFLPSLEKKGMLKKYLTELVKNKFKLLNLTKNDKICWTHLFRLVTH